MTAKPYRLPDPARQPAAALVHVYKKLCGRRYDDREWDRREFPRGMRRATDLLRRHGGDFESAKACLLEVAGWLRAAGLDWRLETVVRRSAEWRAGREKTAHRAAVTDLLGAAPPKERKGELMRVNMTAIIELMKGGE